MTDIHIEILRHHLRLATYSDRFLYWLPDDKTMQRVAEIRTLGNEPGECAIFSNFQHVVLRNVKLSDFAIVERLK